ncbi:MULTISPECIES: molybdopterin molybdotransferase MoeA [unclassified Adlercreutzia]|uniref:molybdopterin molybdotransferase MoeA n=1 Tax=unclassified Adlercreutzia TaxID=2636013 RepID=UPI0013E9CB23|nr:MULTISPECIES: molybdopterin molybdotransferase MoeA [unclassified Adlercreutzia]
MKFEVEKALTRPEAVSALTSRWKMPVETETIRLGEAYGRVTAREYRARWNAPAHRVSAFDGVAVRSADFAGGVPDASAWKPGVDFVRADTGDDFPDAFDAVIAIENVATLPNGGLSFAEVKGVKPGGGVRAAGSQLAEGELLCAEGTVLRPEDVALLAAGGFDAVEVKRKLRIGYLPTGSELVAVGTRPERGETIQSNGLMIRGFVQQWGACLVECPIVADDEELLGAAIDELVASCDIVLVNGGSSRGSEDFCAQLLQERASYFSHGIKAVPGRPVGLAVINGKPALNVPGPMLAAWLACDWLLQALICFYQGQKMPRRMTRSALLDDSLAARPQFERLVRLVADERDDGLHVSAPSRASSLAQNVRTVNAYCALAPGCSLDAGSELMVEMLGTSAQGRARR